jgi:hypothetical protein
VIINRGMIMAKDDDKLKDLGDSEDEDLLDFDFDEDLLGGEEERAGVGVGSEEEVIELADVVGEGKEPESVEGEIEGLEELILEEEAGEEGPVVSEEAEADDLAEPIELKEIVEESAEDVSGAPDHPSLEEQESGEETVLMEKMEGALEEESEEAFLELEKEIKLDEGMEELGAAIEEQPEEPFWEETGKEEAGRAEGAEGILTAAAPVEGMVEGREEAATLPISEKKMEALLTRVVGDVVERVARQVIPEVAERIIREEIDVLKKSITG